MNRNPSATQSRKTVPWVLVADNLKSSIWTLTAYCETAQAFRVLRLDRILLVTPLREVFARAAGRELTDFRALHGL